ncbi:hypothetical protein LCGC14_1217620 [marine sediment metagenome]|uniref:Uncharacterized protein n=1 Tax=marine sediment metagenome TaxID=412755 RepID=A0A0F9LGA5_9ZZZZ
MTTEWIKENGLSCVVCLEKYEGDCDGTLSFYCDTCGRCGFCPDCANPENHDCELGENP